MSGLLIGSAGATDDNQPTSRLRVRRLRGERLEGLPTVEDDFFEPVLIVNERGAVMSRTVLRSEARWHGGPK